ncbi:MAG: adenylyl-sulfate kinase [Butyrivibrio sp.]|nr:adenylyl-sulfate kinase [Butyrivibrio sp.]
MNKNYEKIEMTNGKILKTLEGLKDWKMIDIPEDIPHGDMPGDKIEIGDTHKAKAAVIFPRLVEELKAVVKNNPYERAVITVCGGSGVGKSEIASLLSYMLTQAGIKSYTLSGDNYPHRIPKYNDAERLHLYREGGIRKMVEDKVFTLERFDFVKSLQEKDDDANAAYVKENPWFESYIKGGREALSNYLGTPNETDFAEVENILNAFKDGAKDIWLKRMGRDECALWYEDVDFSDTQVLIIEWTHGNSDYYKGVDVPVLLNSTPAETLAHRQSRNRDGKTDSAFTTTVLEIEQEKLKSQAHKARIILSKNGEILSFDEYQKLMND